MMQEFVQRLQEMASETVGGIHTALPGTVVSFDPETGLAVVTPAAVYKKPDGGTIPYPDIPGVPVYFPQGGGQKASIAYPVRAGDGCLLIISERSLDYWRYGRETDAELQFDLTNSIALVGLFTAAAPGVRQACAEDAVVVTAGSNVFAVSAQGIGITGDISIQAGGATLAVSDQGVTISGDVTIRGSLTTSGGTVRLN